MGYPEPVPAIKAKNVKKFEEKLANFKLTPEQKEFYRKSFKIIRDKKKKKNG
jgi:hypothetical protein